MTRRLGFSRIPRLVPSFARRIAPRITLLIALLTVAGDALSAPAAIHKPAIHKPAIHKPATRVSVKPKTGSTSKRFVVGFRAPDATGTLGAMERRYIVSAAQRTNGTGCVSHTSVTVPPTAAHAYVRVTIDPRTSGGAWCRGRFSGEVQEISNPTCPPLKVCPALVSLLKTVGKFSFRVRSGHGGSAGQGVHQGDTTPPTFAGLKSASACTPGPQRPGQTTPFTLTWDAATDNVTPSSKIVYDVFVAAKQGAENFSSPNWTTGPGATSFKTPGLASHGTFFFVVRARDEAGNEEQNRVERRGIDPCV